VIRGEWTILWTLSQIFISHSSRDDPTALEIGAWLASQGHRSVFLDFDPANGIPAGRHWERELYRHIRACRGVIVVCSREAMASRWCFAEITYARALGKEIFPVRIDDCTIDPMLTDVQVVDFRSNKDDAFSRILRGLIAAGIDPAIDATPDLNRPPYPGLFAFREEDAAIFFGRDEEIGDGLDLLNKCRRLGQPRFVLVLGASGSGKSSLVRAGLLPKLRRDPDRWLIIDPFRPREDPTGELAVVLSRAFHRFGVERSQQSISEDLSRDSNAMGSLATALRRASPNPDATVLVTIDQFEELLGQGEDRPQSRFLQLLRNALLLPGESVIVFATLRSDFINQLQQSAPLLDVAYESLSVGSMSPSDILEVIQRPAELAAIELDPSLVQTLVEDARGQEALPLLAFTLRELTERYGADGRLDLDEYQRGLGGMFGAVAKAAEDLIGREPLGAQLEKDLRRGFLGLVRITDDGKYARRIANWLDLPDSVRPLLERFVTGRLLVSRDEGKGKVVEVAHEALFRAWGRLVAWLRDSDEALRLRQQVAAASTVWTERGRHDDDLWRGGRLVRARELTSSGDLVLDPAEQSFIKASVDVEEAERDQKMRQRRLRMQLLASGAVVAIVLSIAAVYSALRARSAQAEATRAAQTAEERARQASVSEARAKAAQSFAENQRVLGRMQSAEPDSFQAKALGVVAAKYLTQSKAYLATANELDRSLDNWRQQSGLAASPSIAALSVEVLRAGSGGSLLLHFGNSATPRLMLFDGGEPVVYKKSLKPRLDALRQQRYGAAALPIDLVVSSQTDIQHIGGLMALVSALAEERASPPVRISSLWSNAFLPPNQDPSTLISLQQKARLIVHARELGIPINKPFTRSVTLPEAGSARVKWDEGLTITVLGPSLQWLREFAVGWLNEWHRRAKGSFNVPDTFADEVTLESFSDQALELIPSPIEIVRPVLREGADSSYVNLGSIVLLVELAGRRILLPADSRGDILIAALAQAGYTDVDGNVDVDVMVAPHGGSDRNVSVEFFRRVKARHYVFQADGTHNNPEVGTFRMLFEARRSDSRPFTIYLSNPPKEYRSSYPLSSLCKLFLAERQAGTPFQIVTPAPESQSMAIHLLREVADLRAGLQDLACGDIR
jgi:Novel STAND NTPase 1/TIR domain